MADATKPAGSKHPKIKDSVQITKERLGRSHSRLLKTYLVLYNSCQFACWSYILVIWLSVPLPRLWDSVGGAVKAVQTVASLLEIVHSQLGWVRSSLVTNVMQALARHMSLWLVVDLNFSISHSNNSIMDRVVGQQWNTKEVWFGATVAAWASVEVVRYSMYVTEQLGITPSILKFLRYNSFIILYPLGLIGEACGLLLALEAYKSGLCPPTFTACSNNSVGLYLAYFYLIAVVPGFLKLYTHMFAQRRRSSRPATALPAGKADRTASLKDD